MSWTEEQVLAVAPDAASAKAGKDLARPDKWVSAGKSHLALWGECKGSGSKPYQTQVDLGNIAFKCSCPSRKFPCKHGIGLLFLHARNDSAVQETDMPAWVSEWISKRAEKEEKKATKEPTEVKPGDPSAKDKRQAKRHRNVSDGIAELMIWLKDIIKGGILNIPDKPLSFWENLSKRLIDAQAPGLAGMVRTLGDTDFYKEGWQSQFLDGLLHIYLVAQGFERLEQLPADLQEDVRSFVGFTQSQEELKEKQGITDNWLVLSKQVQQEDNLTVERFWLWGTETERTALVLQFNFRGGPNGPLVLAAGNIIDAELVFYPSALPLRALIKKQAPANTEVHIGGYSNWAEVAAEDVRLNSLLPFRSERAYIVEAIKPVLHQDKWWLADDVHNLVQLPEGYTHLYKWLAISGGSALKMAVLGKENRFMPLGLWMEDRYFIL
jgi:hypothetical protein